MVCDNVNTFSKCRALVVEDHPFSRTTLVAMLQKLDLDRVFSAGDGEEAVKILNSEFIDVVITDINMPKMNGIELLKHIRTNKTSNAPSTRVVAVTSYSNVEVIRSCMSLDINAFLVKPITMDNVRTKVLLALDETTELFHESEYESVESDFDCISEDVVTRPAKKEVKKEKPEPPPQRKLNNMSYLTINDLNHLEPGMILMQDLCAKNGVCLVAQGVSLNKRLLNRLHELRSIVEIEQLKVKMLTDVGSGI
ncbi:response regulator [Vibrio sp. SCSIO 43136]|uniref:response regulator n=1 Tax=Vibrio sp. SCSIO 43136 TaxID=2819101 RepID=UPI00207535BD|nr:response regulator [Vibrio sp. SCSIO 43136]USD66905.1 response regulator [Vibrio sp. SCSIO 43136]